MSLLKKIVPLSLPALLAMGCPEPDSGEETTTPSDGTTESSTEPGQPQPFSNPNDARFSVEPGSGVTLSGTFQYAGESAGSYRIDLQKKEGSAPPMLVHAIELDQPGEFSIEVPKNYGTILLLGFVDINADGPSVDDPVGHSDGTILVGEEDIKGVILDVALGNTLNTSPPPADAPTAGGAAPEPQGEASPEGVAPPSNNGAPPSDAPPPDGADAPPSDG